MTCRTCDEEICKHGGCSCEERHCRICARRRDLEAQAEREAIFQTEIIGPMLGWTPEEGG
jgi:hypothetical protein